MLVIMVAQNSPKLTIVRPRGSTLVAQTDALADLPVDLPLAPKKHPSDAAAVAQQAMEKPSGRSEDRRFGFTKELLNRLPCPTNGQRAYYFDTKGSRGFGIAVTMEVKIPTLSKEEALALVEEAHEKVCPYSHATRGNIEFSLAVDGA